MKDYAEIAELFTNAAMELVKAVEADIRNGTLQRTFASLGKMTGGWIGKTLGAVLGGRA